jgi:hypothetical protein
VRKRPPRGPPRQAVSGARLPSVEAWLSVAGGTLVLIRLASVAAPSMGNGVLSLDWCTGTNFPFDMGLGPD